MHAIVLNMMTHIVETPHINHVGVHTKFPKTRKNVTKLPEQISRKYRDIRHENSGTNFSRISQQKI